MREPQCPNSGRAPAARFRPVVSAVSWRPRRALLRSAAILLVASAPLAAGEVLRDFSDLRTPDQWQEQRAAILEGMQEAMGTLPVRAGKLVEIDVRETERLRTENAGYVRLHVTLASGDANGDRIPAHVYEPRGSAPGARRPAMLALHPTSPLGKRIVAGEGPLPNRNYAVELAERGYVVIAPDYPSFGDYADYDFAGDAYRSGTMKGIVNHMRCVDYLQARADVDPERIGVIGHSLGGHNAMFVGVFDQRLKVVVSSCGWTPFHHYYKGDLTGWTSDRYMPALRDTYKLDPDRVPFDFYGIVAALAPRAFFSCSPLHDANFEVGGVQAVIPQARLIYRLLAAEELLQVRYPDAEHDFPVATRLEAYAFIDRVLRNVPPSGAK